tara:strand:+ start:185 stop:1798 length:1614 start_codon:yes stop_codon:yes gene_type:complete
MADIQGIYNVGALDGTVKSDFLELGVIPDENKVDYVDYAPQSFDQYKTALLNYVKAVYPLDYNNFAESDLGVMMIELFAYVASVSSFKADMLTNEMFLPTVKSKGNLRKLLALIGVTLKGPISSKAGCKISVASTHAITGSTSLTLPLANRVLSVPNTKDGGVLSFTTYEVDINSGQVDIQSPDIVLFSGDSAGAAGTEFNNLILLEGELKTLEGTFSELASVQTIDISDASIVEGSIVVSSVVDGVFSEIENIFLATSTTSKVFQKIYKEDNSATLVFGDGARGKIPPPNTDYLVMYRVGGGDRGNIPRSHISITTEATHSSLGTTEITLTNSTQGTGGSNAESVEHAKKWAPYTFRTQYRAVTGEDYTTFANQFVSTVGSTGKALAVLRRSGAGANMIDIYLVSKASALQLERASIAHKQELLTYMNKYKMLTDEVTIVDGLVRTVDLVLTVSLRREMERFEEEVKRKVADRVTEYFNVDNREFGERLDVSELNRVIFTLDEVQFSKLDNIDENIKLNFNEILQLNNIEINVDYV